MTCDALTVDDVGIDCVELDKLAGRLKTLTDQIVNGDQIAFPTIILELRSITEGVTENVRNIRQAVGVGQ